MSTQHVRRGATAKRERQESALARWDQRANDPLCDRQAFAAGQAQKLRDKGISL